MIVDSRSKRTLVFQSWFGQPAPRFIERCTGSVAAWAERRGFDYQCLDETFLDPLPAWYRERLTDHVVQQTNLARLLQARDAHARGYARAAWIDADVLVFDAERFEPDAPGGFALCREVWMRPDADGYTPMHAVNQAMVIADRGHPLLDYLIWANESLVRDRPDRVQRFGTATALLSAIHAATPLPLATDVAMMNPRMIAEIAGGDAGPMTREYVRRHGYPTFAANLTLSMVGFPYDGVIVGDADVDAAIDVLLATRGAPLDLGRAYDASAAQSRGTR